jgi:type II secretory pathway component PulK
MPPSKVTSLTPHCMRFSPRRRAIILPLALLVLGLLTVLAAQVVFRSNADIAAVQAAEATFKARMAAEAGIQKVIAVLQGGSTTNSLSTTSDQPRGRIDMDAWYSNPEYFRGLIVQGATSSTSSGVQGEAVPQTVSWSNPATWRFSVVGNDPLAQATDTTAIRYGITDEASKLNLNVATAEQLTTLLQAVLHNPQVSLDDLVRSILYWRSKAGKEDAAEDAYYQGLDHPYQVKHAPFGSVEELLLVHGVTGQILFGEDWNRNGILDANENDGDASFPPDNGDGQLDRGLYPYLTVWSSEPNKSNTNKPRAYLNDSNPVKIEKALPAYITDEQKNAIQMFKRSHSFKTPLDLLVGQGGNAAVFTMDDLDSLVDDMTCVKATTCTGLVNVNTAPVEVLVAVGFTEDEAHRIVSTRASLAGKDKTTLAWLIRQNVVDAARLNDAPELFNSITARAYQFHVESVGFADHVGAFCRLETIIKMQGHTCQIAYWRDLSSLGLGWPVHGQEGSIAGATH